MADKDPFVELRGQGPRTLVDVLDAVSTARRLNRWELIVQILEVWAEQQQREAIAILRVAGTEEPREARTSGFGGLGK